MCLNATKTKTILFGSKGKTISVKYKNDLLESVDSIKYLGVMIDKHLTWSLHVQNVIKKSIKDDCLYPTGTAFYVKEKSDYVILFINIAAF